MQCQECSEREATLHFTKIINGEKTEFHLCEGCARDKGEMLPGVNNSFSIHNLLSGLMDIDPVGGSVGQTHFSTPRCDHCGLTYAQFTASGRFGCARCYQAFGARLDPLLSKVHSGNVDHHGKIPLRSSEKLKTRRKMQESKKKLEQAISQEEFEEAAKLRDEIRKLENEIPDV